MIDCKDCKYRNDSSFSCYAKQFCAGDLDELKELTYHEGWWVGFQEGREDGIMELLDAIDKALRKSGYMWTDHQKTVWNKIKELQNITEEEN